MLCSNYNAVFAKKFIIQHLHFLSCLEIFFSYEWQSFFSSATDAGRSPESFGVSETWFLVGIISPVSGLIFPVNFLLFLGCFFWVVVMTLFYFLYDGCVYADYSTVYDGIFHRKGIDSCLLCIRWQNRSESGTAFRGICRAFGREKSLL